MIVLGSGPLEDVYESGGFINKISASFKKAEALLPCEETTERCWYEPGRGPSPKGNQADLGLSSLQKCGQQISMCYKPSSHWFFVGAA